MKVTAISLTAPPAAAHNPKATPELLASCLAKYSRSNKGLDCIMSSIDWSNPEKSVEAIFKFIDYGHASIGGLTSGIPMAIDGASMFMVYRLFELSPKCDGQESSTRYIKMDTSSLPDPAEIGIPEPLQNEWRQAMTKGYEANHYFYEKLDRQAKETPEIVRIPDEVQLLPEPRRQKTIARIRTNYALDRARYFIPFSTKTNAALVMTARDWAQTIRGIEAMQLPEAQQLAGMLRTELSNYAAQLVRHSHADKASIEQWRQEASIQQLYVRDFGVRLDNIPDESHVSVEMNHPRFLGGLQTIPEAFRGKENRYSMPGTAIRRQMVRFAFNNIAIAELRDINRHRTGHRFSPLYPVGFYLPPEVDPNEPLAVEAKQAMAGITAKLAATPGLLPYGYLLGSQTPFEHSTHADKFIYEVELRTGAGAHFRYAQHLGAVADQYLSQCPDARGFITVGTAEPE
jgi:thymidylate synthase ThyX